MMSSAAASKDLKWPHMSVAQKMAWWGKLLIAICSFGFVYPHVMSPHLRDSYDARDD
jgi:hypothetical protein